MRKLLFLLPLLLLFFVVAQPTSAQVATDTPVLTSTPSIADTPTVIVTDTPTNLPTATIAPVVTLPVTGNSTPLLLGIGTGFVSLVGLLFIFGIL